MQIKHSARRGSLAALAFLFVTVTIACHPQADPKLNMDAPLPVFLEHSSTRILERTRFSAQVRIDNKPATPMLIENRLATTTLAEGLSVGPTIVNLEFFYTHPQFGQFMVASVQKEIDITLEGPNELVIDPLDYQLTDIDGDGVPDIDELDEGRNPIDLGAARWTFSPLRSQPVYPTVGREPVVVGYSSTENMRFGLNANGSLRWRQPLPYELISTKRDENGDTYVIDEDYNLLSYSADGEERWIFELGLCQFHGERIEIADDGTVYVNCDDFGLYAINSDGTQRWFVNYTDKSFQNFDPSNIDIWNQASAVSGIILDPARGVVVASADKTLYAYDLEGNYRWQYENTDFLVGALETDAAGNIYFTTIAGQVSSLDPDGGLRWSSSIEDTGFAFGLRSGTTPTLTDSDVLLVRLNETTLYSLDLDGNLLWSLDFGNSPDTGPSSIESDPIIAADGTIYISTTTHYINAVSPQGDLSWQIPGNISNAQLELSEEHVYVSSDRAIVEVSIEQRQRTWVFYPNQTIRGTPAVDSNGNLYVATDGASVYGIDALGNFIWEVQVKGRVLNSVSLDDNENVLVADLAGYITSITSAGEIRWQVNSEQSNGSISSSVAVALDGTAYVTDGLGDIIAINSAGEFKWRYQTADRAWFGTPVVAVDGTIYAVTVNHVHAIDPQGELLWKFVGNPIEQDPTTNLLSSSFQSSSPAIGSEGEVYAANSDGKLYAINSDGTSRWVFDTGFRIRFASPTIGDDGVIYIGNWRDGLIAINRNGSELWRNPLSGSVVNGVTVLADGSLVVGSTNRIFQPENFIYLLNPDGSERYRIAVDEWPVSSVGTDQFGNLYFSDGPDVKSFSGDSPLSSTALWPKVHRGNANSNRGGFRQ